MHSWLGVVLRDFGWVLLVSSVLTGYGVGFFWRYFRMEEDATDDLYLPAAIPMTAGAICSSRQATRRTPSLGTGRMGMSLFRSQGCTMSAPARMTPAPPAGCSATRLMWQAGTRMCMGIASIVR